MRRQSDPLREQQPPATGEAPNGGLHLRTWARNLAIAGAAGIFLAAVGAMGTGASPPAIRFGYWVPLMMVGSVVAHGVVALVTRFLPVRDNLWLLWGALSLALTVPLTFLVWGYTSVVLGAEIPPSGLPELFFSVLLIAAAMTAIMIAVNRPGPVTHAAPGDAPAPARFLERLPAKLKGAALYAVQSEDHYLRLHTSKGADLILMRLSDAIVELEGIEGAQVHRSWWVARDAVEAMRRDGDRVTLTLKDGGEAPVSRPNVRPLREAGWY